LKHAFPDKRPGAGVVVSYRVAGTDWELIVSDNGIGKPDVNANATKPGLGTSLVKALTRQLDAVVQIASDSCGTAVSITHATFKAKSPNRNEMPPV
jgi:two-component sensor histidine kinase